MKDIRKVIGLLLCMTICCYMTGEEKKNLNIVFIGNSITQGVLLENPRHEAPPVKAALYLRRQPSVGTVRYSNQGVSGSTTFDFLPQTDLLFPKVVRVADQFKDETWATLIFSIMLGTNDSAITGPNGAPASPAKYYENMKTIIDKLLALYPECKIVLHRPVWYSPNTYNGAKYLEEGLNRLQSYYPELQALVLDYSKHFPGQVFMGDTDGFDYFKTHYKNELFPEKGNAGTGKGLLLWESCGGKRYLGQLTINKNVSTNCQLSIINCPLFLSFAQSVVKDTNMAFAIILQLFYDFFSCRFFFNLLANEPKEEVS